MRRLSIVLCVACCAAALAAESGPLSWFETTTYESVTRDAVVVTDVDGDGRVDALAVGEHGTISLRRSLGDGRFEDVPRELVQLDAPSSVFTVADFDADGDPDVVVATDVDTVLLLRNDGSGEFDIETLRNGSSSEPAQAPIFVMDTDADGKPEFIVRRWGGLHAYSLDRRGSYAYRQWIGPEAPHAYVADFDEDGRDDVLTSTYLVLGRQFGTPASVGGPPPEQEGSVSVVVDLDRDGHTDVIRGRTVYYGAGDGTFPRTAALPQPVRAAGAAADLDNDGDLDLVLADHFDVPRVLRNDGGVFSEDGVLAARAVEQHDVVLAHLDDNGRIDVISSSQLGGAPQRLHVMLQDGTPPPRELAVVSPALDAPGQAIVQFVGTGLVPGAELVLDGNLEVLDAEVTDETSVRVTFDVPPAAGGGTRVLRLTNPDRQTTTTTVEVHSVSPRLRKGRLRVRRLPGLDVLRLRGTLSRNALSRNDGFTGRDAGLTLAIGDPAAPLVITIPAADPRWTEKSGGRVLRFRTEPDQFPRVTLDVDTRRETFRIRVILFDYVGDPDGDMHLSYESAGDVGAVMRRWYAPRPRAVRRFR